MTFESEFLKPMEAEIEVKIRRRTKAAKIEIARRAYEFINLRWPRDTGWSVYNNRITINSGDFILDPPERPGKRGALVNAATNENARELDKLEFSKVRFDDTVRIGNAVPYAADVGNEPGNGINIYAESLREAASSVLFEIGSGAIPSKGPRFKGR